MSDQQDNQCHKINISQQTLNFLVERSRILDAYEESIRLVDLISFSSSGDHQEEVCPRGGECLVVNPEKQEEIKKLSLKLKERSDMISNVINECHEFSHSSDEMEVKKDEDGDDEDVDQQEGIGGGEDDGGWVLGAHMFGIKTYYKTDDDGQISLRMEAEQEVPVFEQMAVLYECELYSDWIPFCTSSSLVKKISHAEQIFHAYFTTPFAVRDMLIHVYAADCVMSHGCVAFVGRSVTDGEINEDKETAWPPQPNYFFGCRAEILQLSGVMRMTSNKSAKTIILMKVNPKIHLPQMLINFLIRKMAGVFLYFLERKAVSLTEEVNLDSNKHAIRMRDNAEFYVDWLLPAVRAYCHFKGWDQFTVRLLGDDGIPEEGKVYLTPDVVLS